MKPILKWVGIVAASLAGLLVLAVAYVLIGSQRILDRRYPIRPSAVHANETAEAVARGAHLVVVSTCTDCHGKDLTGTRLPVPGSVFYAPNLTTMTGSLSDADIDLVIRQGLHSDGKSVLLMPSHGYASFTDGEVASIIAYLRSLSPHGAASPKPRFGLEVRAALVMGIFRSGAAEFTQAPPPLDLGVRYQDGRHLAQVVCGQCHGTDLSGEPKRPVRASPDLVIVAGYDRDAFRTFMRMGRATGGRQTVSMLRIAGGNLSNLTDAEVGAIYDYLVARWKTLAARRNAPSQR